MSADPAFLSRVFTSTGTLLACRRPSPWLKEVPPGGSNELDAYLQLLSRGCSKDSARSLASCWRHMEQPGPIDAALKRFGELVDELDPVGVMLRRWWSARNVLALASS